MAVTAACLLALAALMVGCGGGGAGGGPPGPTNAIIFMHQSPGANREVWMMLPNGANPRPVAASAGRDHIQGTLSPDGRKLLYVEQSQADNTSEMVVKDLHTGATTVLISDNSAVNDFAPAYSPDGTRIAYLDHRDNAIHVINANGIGDMRITAGASERTPAWNADGAKIAYEKNWQHGSVCVANADGSDETVILAKNARYAYEQPRFLPDGRIIATRYDLTLRTRDLVLANGDGSGLTLLTPDTPDTDEFYPSVCGANIIAYASNVAGVKDIWIATLSGAALANPINLTATLGGDNWRPNCGIVDASYFNLP